MSWRYCKYKTANIGIEKNHAVIVKSNDDNAVTRCVSALKRAFIKEVYIVDNGLEGKDADILEDKYKGYIKLIRNKENLGFCEGNNVGIRKAIKENSDYALLLNNDTVVEPNFLEELVKTTLRDEKIAIIGSLIADYAKKTVFTNAKIDGKLKLDRRLYYLNSDKEWWETEGVSGASMILKTEYILKYSLFFDEDLFLYCDEIDLCTRAKRVGLKVVIAGKSKVYYKEGQTTGGAVSAVTVYYVIRNRIILSKKLLSFKDKIMFWTLFYQQEFLGYLNGC